MGILNVTPDSFSDGGRFQATPRAVEHALSMLEEGADVIDVGGESTRPGAPEVSAEDEMRRVLPVIEGIMQAAPDCVLSIDTSKASVARAAVEGGASIVNDVTALRGDAEMVRVAAETGVGVVLMHMQGNPRTMQHSPSYRDVVSEVSLFLAERRDHAMTSGISPECVAVDPGIGFGKTAEHNLMLLRHLGRCAPPGCPLLLGVSRKSFVEKIAGAKTLHERVFPTVALSALMLGRGARIFRVHDVRANWLALRAAEKIFRDDFSR